MTRIFLFAITALILFSSCSEKSYSYAYSSKQQVAHGRNSDAYKKYSAEMNSEREELFNAEESPAAEERRVIYNASLELQSKQVDTTNARLMGIAHRYGGYVMSTGPERSSIRVRAEKLNDALNDIARLGKVKERRVWGNDVTEEYMDLEIRLDNLKKTRLRYLDLLQKANNVEETLKVEKELERLSREIDLIEGKLNRLSHLTEYSTIDVYYKSRPKPGVLGYAFIGLYKGVKWLFVRG